MDGWDGWMDGWVDPWLGWLVIDMTIAWPLSRLLMLCINTKRNPIIIYLKDAIGLDER